MPKGKRVKGIAPIREPSGRLQRSLEAELGAATPAEARRLRDAALAGMASPEWGSELGRLFLAGKISPTIYEAGKRWARLAEAYHRATGAPPQAPSTSMFSGSGRQSPPDPDSEEGRRQRKREERIVTATTEALAILHSLGVAIAQIVRRVCEEDRAPLGDRELQDLITGLSWLAEHWGLEQAASRRSI